MHLGSLLPFIKKYTGSTIVIKYGGSAMTDLDLCYSLIQDIILLYYLNINIILIHGGGPFINQWLLKLNIQPKFNNGIRITDNQTLELVQMVLLGKVNSDLVSLFNRQDDLAIGLSGNDSNLIIPEPLFSSSNNFVATVKSINSRLLNLLLVNKYIPIIASIASNDQGQMYNINADTIAGYIAAAMKADKLILLTDTPGIMTNINDNSSLIKQITTKDLKKLKADKVIIGGMIPKVNACVTALNNGVQSTHIINGTYKHSLLYELFSDFHVGSTITI
uniref:Acetylglutamate kinase n=1 Tax=Wrangelia sp. TaxID=2575620 RepID=A0A4D6X1M1_9FLOR|nr:acetylglutamate kinase [Wrangelia sp.]